jgi:hypothetical protein
MPRALADYGLADDPELASMAVEDPALLDSLVVRMIEDLDLSAYTAARFVGVTEIDSGVAGEVVSQLLGDHLAGVHLPPSDAFRDQIRQRVNELARSPLPYVDDAQSHISDAVSTAAYNYLQVGANGARGEGADVIKLRHYLPACEEWPYPLNRFC